MIRILWQDAHVAVVEKPSGLPSQPGPGHKTSVTQWLDTWWPDAHLPHRLDLPASGLLLVVLDPTLNAAIAHAFAHHKIERTYLAILAGDRLKTGEQCTWNGRLDGKDAQSDVHVLGTNGGLLAAKLQLSTGRTHQLRRHAAAAGLPILGDRRYGGEVGTWAPRLALHAAALRFTHPVTAQAIRVVSPLPAPLDQLWLDAGGQHDATAAL